MNLQWIIHGLLIVQKAGLSVSPEGYQVHIRYKLYPVTFGNDDKSHQNKSHNEFTVPTLQKWQNFRG